jgi:DNA-3-methyladenine glycosylase
LVQFKHAQQLSRKLGPSDRPLGSRFFNRNAEDVARDLIGSDLVRRRGHRLFQFTITETEAYVGPHDLACHASRGRTTRTEPMFGPPGTLYVYLIYGLHWMLNVVTGPVGYPAAVLIRSAGGIMGPGRLAKALEITGALNGSTAAVSSGVWFSTGDQRISLQMICTPRVGVNYAGPIWSMKPLRFLSKNEEA